MLVPFLEVLLFILLIRLLTKSWRPMAWCTLFLVTIWSILWLFLVQLELLYISPDGTYGSDARYYYEAMISALHAGTWLPPEGVFNYGYVAFGTFVLRTSPSDSVVWVKLANIGLMLACLALGFYILQSWNISKKISFYTMILVGINGIVTWMVVRNLKDTLFLFLTLVLIVGTKFLLSRECQTRLAFRIVGILALGLVSAWTLESVRQWGPYWALCIITATIIETFSQERLQFKISKSQLLGVLTICLALVMGLLVIFNQSVIRDLFMLYSFAERSGGLAGAGLKDIALAVPKFIIGPGPIRAFFGWEIFEVTTSIGNILIALGATLWWIYLPVLVLALLQGPNYWLKYASVLVPLLVFVTIYSFAYSGSADTRFLAIAYLFSFLITAPYLDMILQYRKIKRFLVNYAGIAILVWICGALTSYISLAGN
jgi:hypothetical protein